MPPYNSPPEFRDAFLPYPELTNTYFPRDIWKNKVSLTDKELSNFIARYDGGVLYADSILKALIGEMKQLGLYQETIVVITSDHGEALGEHDHLDGHGGFWEEGLRVPLLLKPHDSHPYHSRFEGVEMEHNVQSIDIAPTLLSLVDLPIPEFMEGRNLLDSSSRDVIASKGQMSVMVRGSLKIKMNILKNSVRLYDLVNDPDESDSIHAKEPKIARQMASDLQVALRSQQQHFESLAGDADRSVVLEPEKVEQLKALGYLN